MPVACPIGESDPVLTATHGQSRSTGQPPMLSGCGVRLSPPDNIPIRNAADNDGHQRTSVNDTNQFKVKIRSIDDI